MRLRALIATALLVALGAAGLASALRRDEPDDVVEVVEVVRD
jgi:hypothetical protein